MRLCRELARVTRKNETDEHTDGATVQITLEVLRLPGPGASSVLPLPYHALSYVWGDPEDVLPIVCDGELKWVTRNLYEALQRLWVWTYRESTDPTLQQAIGFGRPLWIDALCINQDDPAEKSHQIEQMGNIFRTAEKTYVWLGADLELAESTWPLVFELDTRQGLDYDPCPPRANGITYLSDLDVTLASETGRTELFAHLNPLMDLLASNNYSGVHSLTTLFNLPYWSRAWVIQELALANHNKSVVTLGDKLWSWANVVNAAHTLMVVMYLVNHERQWPKIREWDVEMLAELREAAVGYVNLG